MEIGCLGRLHGANLILTAILEDTANPSWNDLRLSGPGGQTQIRE